MKFAVFQFVPIASCPATEHHWKELWNFFEVFIQAGKIPWTCSSPGWKIPTLSASSHMSDAAVPSSPLWTCTGLTPACPRLSGTERPQHRVPDIFHQGWAEGKDHLPRPADNVLSCRAQKVPGCLCCRWFLLPCGQSVHQDPHCLMSTELLWGQTPSPASVWGYPAPYRQLELGTNENIKKPTTRDSQKSARSVWRLSPLSLGLVVLNFLEHLPRIWEAWIVL